MDTANVLGSVSVEVKADLEKLLSGFGKARVESAQLDRDLGKVTGQTRLNAAAQLELANAYNTLIKRYDPLKDKTQRYVSDLAMLKRINQSGLFNDSELQKLNTGMALLAPASLKAKEGMEQLATSTGKTRRLFSAFSLESLAIRRIFTGLFLAVGIQYVRNFASMVTSTLRATAAIKDQAIQLGLTTRQLQEYRGIAADVGMTQDDMDGAFQTFNRTIANAAAGQTQAGKLFKLLGINIRDAKGQIKPTNDLFLEMIDRLGQVGNKAERAAGLAAAFGEAYGPKMAQLVDQGSAGVDGLRKAVEDTGIVLSDEQIQKADQTAKKLDQVKQVLQVRFASAVVDNAQAIDKLSTALLGVASAAISAAGSMPGALHLMSNALDGFVGRALSQIPGLGIVVKMIHYLGSAGNQQQLGQTATVTLPAPTPATPKPKPGGNISLSGLLSPKPPKGRSPHEKFDQFESDMARELEQQLQLEKEATGDILRQNEIDKQIIDLKLKQQLEQIKKQLHNKQLTAKEAEQLSAAAKNTASMQKEAADRTFRLAQIDQSYQFADEGLRLEQQGLEFQRATARTDKDRRRIDLALVSIKQQEEISAIEKEIDIAKEKKDQNRVTELTAEKAKILANQVKELDAFDIEHLTGMAKFKNDLPRSFEDLQQAISDVRFDLFNERLQQAAQFAGDIGGAFGRAAGALARFESPVKVLQGLISDLADTFTKNFIEKPVEDFISKKLGQPLAEQLFGKQLMGAGLSAQQMSVALGLATNNLYVLAAAAQAAAAASGAGAASGFASSIGSALLGGAGIGGASGFGSAVEAAAGSDFMAGWMGGLGGLGFAGGGFTGSGTDNDIAGVVHKNEWVWDADTTRRFRPLLQMISAGKLPQFTGPGMGGMMRPQAGDRHFHFGDIVVPGVRNERDARSSGRQVLAVIQRGLSDTAKSGVNRR